MRWCWRSAEDAQEKRIASRQASDHCVWFRGGGCLVFRLIPSELNCSDRGSRFFHRDYDSSKSLLHGHAQRLTRSSPTRTGDQDCFSPSRLHLDVGEVDFTSHIHVPAVSVQSRVPSDVLSNCTGHAAAVSSQSPSDIAKMIASAVRCLMVPVLQ